MPIVRPNVEDANTRLFRFGFATDAPCFILANGL